MQQTSLLSSWNYRKGSWSAILPLRGFECQMVQMPDVWFLYSPPQAWTNTSSLVNVRLPNPHSNCISPIIRNDSQEDFIDPWFKGKCIVTRLDSSKLRQKQCIWNDQYRENLESHDITENRSDIISDAKTARFKVFPPTFGTAASSKRTSICQIYNLAPDNSIPMRNNSRSTRVVQKYINSYAIHSSQRLQVVQNLKGQIIFVRTLENRIFQTYCRPDIRSSQCVFLEDESNIEFFGEIFHGTSRNNGNTRLRPRDCERWVYSAAVTLVIWSKKLTANAF